jgi:toxin ParE1/3/4
MRIRWTRRALRDLREIGAYIARDNPAAARRWVGRLKERAERVEDAPRAGRIVAELEREDVREVFLGNYRIVYRILPEAIDIVTVFEGHRLFPKEQVEIG